MRAVASWHWHPAPSFGTLRSMIGASKLCGFGWLTGALLALALVLALDARADPPALTRGRILFLHCASCHDISAAASPKIGPSLWHIIDRPVAGLEGFRYSTALKTQDFRWDRVHLDRWLADPGAMVPGTSMPFGGIGDPADRQALIDFLAETSSSEPN
jgi:cytochrome c